MFAIEGYTEKYNTYEEAREALIQMQENHKQELIETMEEFVEMREDDLEAYKYVRASYNFIVDCLNHCECLCETYPREMEFLVSEYIHEVEDDEELEQVPIAPAGFHFHAVAHDHVGPCWEDFKTYKEAKNWVDEQDKDEGVIFTEIRIERD